MSLEKLMSQQFKDLMKGFKLVFGNKDHIQIAKLMGDIVDREKKIADMERSDFYIKKTKEEIASLQSKVVMLIKKCK